MSIIMDADTRNDLEEFMRNLDGCKGATSKYFYSLWSSLYQSNHQSRYSKPMPLIGMYIALASLLCCDAIMFDLFHGLWYRKLWLPCKIFTLNAVSLTVMGVAIKLPMDLTNLMPGYVDQAAKLGSLAFMCSMMANLLPSLATMNSKELVSNVLALGVVVITLVVNVCIQLNTGVLSYHAFEDHTSQVQFVPWYGPVPGKGWIPTIYVVLLLLLLMIYACSSLAILRSKEILEQKYQAAHENVLKDQASQKPGSVTVEKLKQHVSKYLIMARTGNPQFMTVCFVTTMASGVICVSSTFLHLFIIISNFRYLSDYTSDYKRSILWILVVQSLGVIISTIAPIVRCVAALSFKLSLKWIGNHINVFKIESYWTEMLYYKLKQCSIPSSPSSSSNKFKIGIDKLKILILSICIGFQKTVVVICKTILLIPVLLLISVFYGFRFFKWLAAMCISSGINVSVSKPRQQTKDKNLSGYVLQLQDNVGIAERALKGISKAVNSLIEKGEKQQPNNLIKFLPKSKSFEGLGKFESRLVPSLLPNEYLNCWRLPLVTLTTIAISLPIIPDNKVDCLLSSVTEGLAYVTFVEESLNTTDDHASIQQVAESLWQEVKDDDTWLGNKLREYSPQVNTAGQILQCFSESAKNTVTEVEKMAIGDRNDISKRKSIAANSMYRITETIMLSHINVSEEELFELLSSWISDILAACLTNLPQVIAMECHTNAIEKRETIVRAAAQLLGMTMELINTINKFKHPDLNPDELAYIEKWQAKYN